MKNYKDASVLDWVVSLYESAENLNRLEKHFKDYQISFGNQMQYIERDLMARYPESWDSMTKINLKISKKIIRKLSRCYSQGLRREVVDKKTGNVNEALTTLINYIYDDVDHTNRNLNMIMTKANQYYTNHRYVELFAYVDKGKRIRFKPLPQHLFMAIPNREKTRAEAIVFKHDTSETFDYSQHIDWEQIPTQFKNAEVDASYTIWTEKDNFSFVRLKAHAKDDDGMETGEIIYKTVITDNDNNKDGENPYGWNFVQIKEDVDGAFYPYGSEIPETSKDLCVIFSDLVSIAANQGFGQAVIYYDSETPPPITKSGPTHVINVPNKTGNSKFEFANPNPDLKGHLDIALNIVRILLTTNDLTTDKVSGELNATNFASAIDRLIADSETLDNIDDQRKIYVSAEKKLFKVVISILNYLAETGAMPVDYPKIKTSDLDAEKYDLRVTFNSIKPITTEKDKAETIVYLDENGFILPWEKHTRFNDGMNQKEAQKREEEIRKIKADKAENAMKKQVENVRGQEDASINNQENRLEKDAEGTQGENQKPFNSDQRRQNTFRQRNSRPNQRENEGRKGRNFYR